jgi:hypothetical protein
MAHASFFTFNAALSTCHSNTPCRAALRRPLHPARPRPPGVPSRRPNPARPRPFSAPFYRLRTRVRSVHRSIAPSRPARVRLVHHLVAPAPRLYCTMNVAQWPHRPPNRPIPCHRSWFLSRYLVISSLIPYRYL